MLPTNLFWADGGSVVARGFHLHPAAIIKRPDTSFRSTIDGDLLDCFPREAIHVVVDPDDCSMCEVSPPERRFPVRGLHFTPQLVAGAMRSRASATHRWLFEHRITVRGTGVEVVGDAAIARAVLECLGHPEPASVYPERPGRPERAPFRLRGRVPAGPRLPTERP